MLADPVDITAGLQMEEELFKEISDREFDLGYFLWRSKQALVVPRSATRKDKFKTASIASAEKGWPVVVRSTGGELTPQCESFFNLSIFMRTKEKQLGIKDSYLIICTAIIDWLKKMGIKGECASIDGAFCDGDFNVNIDGKKLVGTAQRWRNIPASDTAPKEKALLLHAVVLCGGDIERLLEVSNAFYTMCASDPFIKKDKHISLAEVTESDDPQFVENCMADFKAFMDTYMTEVAKKAS